MAKPEPEKKEVDPLAHLRLDLDKVVERVACPTCDTFKTEIEKKALDQLKHAKDLKEAEIIFGLAKFRTDLMSFLDDHCKTIPEDRKKIEEALGIKKPEEEKPAAVKRGEELLEWAKEHEKITPPPPIKPQEKVIKPKEEIKSSE